MEIINFKQVAITYRKIRIYHMNQGIIDIGWMTYKYYLLHTSNIFISNITRKEHKFLNDTKLKIFCSY